VGAATKGIAAEPVSQYQIENVALIPVRGSNHAAAEGTLVLRNGVGQPAVQTLARRAANQQLRTVGPRVPPNQKVTRQQIRPEHSRIAQVGQHVALHVAGQLDFHAAQSLGPGA
jgi:hypothetical protein